jgi:hypothetical protein
MGHKRIFNAAMKNLVENYFGSNSALYTYLDAPDLYKAALLDRKIIQKEAKEFGTLIRQNHSLLKTVKSIINESLFRQHDPEFDKSCDQLYSDFSENIIDVEEFKTKVKEELISRRFLNEA